MGLPSPRSIAVATWLVVCATAGCLSVYAPVLRGGVHHAGLDRSTSDETCLDCHEPETAAMARLRALPASTRHTEMERMMGQGGASLVAAWMIDDPRGCVGCHAIRGER